MYKKNWKQFEELVLRIQNDIAKDAIVSHNESLIDKSGIKRQIDVLIKQKIGFDEALIIVECKRHKHPIPIGLIESFCTKLKDLNASYGILVSSNGFTKGAIKKAELHNVKLYSIESALEENWKKIVGKAAWLDFIKSEIESLRVETIPNELQNLSFESEFLDNEGNIFSLKQIFETAKDKFDINEEPGNHRLTILFEHELFSKNENSLITEMNVSFTQKAFLYSINLEFQEGYRVKDELSGELKLEEVFSGSIDWEKILKGKERQEINKLEYDQILSSGKFQKFKTKPKKYLRLGFKKEGE